MKKKNVDVAKLFADKCYNNGTVMIIQPRFGVKYDLEDQKYEFTENIADEIVNRGLAKITYRDDKYVNMMGYVN